MRFFRRKPLSSRFASHFRFPRLEMLEDRTLPSADPLSAQFQSVGGLLTLHGDNANHLVSASLSSVGFVDLNVAGQLFSSNPGSINYDPALAGVTGQTLKAIQFDGSAGLDQLTLGNLNVAGGLSVQCDGIVNVQGQVSAAGPIQLSGHAVLLAGQVRADGLGGGSIAVSADNVLQSGLLEANGSQGAGGSIRVDFTGSYVATVSAVTSASSTGAGGGGLLVIDGHAGGTLFSSGQYQANAGHGGPGGEIDLFAQQVHLVGAGINASGWSGGGWVRVGGDSPADIAAHGGSAGGVSYANVTTVEATTTLAANALGAGNGGHIVVWSQQSTTFGGTLSAQGAGPQGQGGLLEVSSAGVLTYGGHASATGSGQQGRLLLDPANLIISSGVGLPQFNLVNPDTHSGDTFGASMVLLNNGNVVVADPESSLAAANAGAVFLFNGQTGALLGTLTGSTSGDQVGSGTNGTNGVTALNDGDYVVSSPNWQNGGVPVGAATWVSGSGSTATVSAANSLIGSTSGDQVGSGGVTALSNDNYVVSSPFWQNGGVQVGAVTWGNGIVGTFSAVSAANSLVGSTSGDEVGSDGVTALTNGNYVVSSSFWQNPNGSGGAVTWGNGVGGTVGPVSALNSLVGDVNSGEVGPGVTALSDGNYVVASPGWQNAGNPVGAVTWGNGSSGIVGDVSPSNSLVGSVNFDSVGSGGVKALSNGNYVVSSPGWYNAGAAVGAVTWGAAGGVTIGAVTTGNSLVGSADGDDVGSGGVTVLSNGDYVVSSPNWQNGVGAVTWSNGTTGQTINGAFEAVSAGNSLVGSTSGDYVGYGNGNPGSGVTALSNGNYVVSSPNWQDGGADVGAVTWGASNGSTVGPVTTGNSLVGSTNGDQVGSGGVTALSNGNYVVSSPFWQNGGAAVGAVTLGNGTSGTIGSVTINNSLVGSTSGDNVGSGGVTPLSNGNYVVSSPNWQNAGAQVGAATWSNGSTGQTIDGTNAIDAVNSLIGTSSTSLLQQVIGLPGGSSFLASFSGNGGSVIEVQVAVSSETYATAADQTLSLSPSFITATLDTDTAVVLQASNDITVSSPIVVDNPSGNGGNLTLQAGRNIIIDASITTDNGNLTLIANDTAADGVVNSERGTGVGAITMTAGTALNAGTGNVTVTLDTGAGNTNYATDDITLGDITAHNITLTNNGPGDASISGTGLGSGVDMASVTASGNLTVLSTGDITQAGALAVSDPDIINVTGTTRLTASGGLITLNNSNNVFSQVVTYTAPGGNVTLDASGNLVLASPSAAARLTVATSGVLATSQFLTVSGAASFTAGTILLTDPLNNLQGLVSLSSTGTISLVDSTALAVADLTLAGAASLGAPSITFDGALNVGAQTLSLTSTGPAQLDGNTTLAGGKISDSSGLDVGAGTTLSGSGTLQVGAGSAGVLAQVGATLSPGLTPGGLTVNGDLTLAPVSILNEQIKGTTQFSQLTVNDAVNLGGATLQVTFLNPYTPTVLDRFEIVNNGSVDAVTGTFAQGSSVTVAGTTLTIIYTAGTGNDVVLTVAPPAPVANVDVASMPENSPATAINVLANDTGTEISITGITQPAHGTVVITGGGSGLTYQPSHLFNGVDTFTYTITDGAGVTATATVVVFVTGLPVANTDVATLPQNASATAINVLANDTGTGITITGITQGAHGAVAITGGGSGLTYQPNNVFNGLDTFTYTITDSVGNTATGTVDVTVTAVSQPPVVTVPGPMQFVANKSLAIAGISAADPGQGNPAVQATLSVQSGILTLGSIAGLTSVQGNGTASVVVSGALDIVNLDLSTLSYLAKLNTAQADALTVMVNDLGGSDPKAVALTPNPGISVVADPTLPGKQDLVIQGSAGNDVVTVAPGKGTGVFQVALNGPAQTIKGITGRILVFGMGGNDTITLNSKVKLSSLLVVGVNGNSIVTGGGGVNTFVESGDVDFKLAAGSKGRFTLTKGTSHDTLNHIQKIQLSLTGPDSHTINGTAFSGPETLLGGTGSDTLLAGSGNDVLVGGSGNDRLVAGVGKNILIAGGGADTLVGGPNQDLLIGGSTIYDNNMQALNAIMAEWASTDTYAVKIKHLLGTQSGGKNGSTLLTASTVQNNSQASTLTGGKGQDWFWTSSQDSITDLNNGGKETNTHIT